MCVQGVNNKSMLKSAGIGAAVGACVGLPKLYGGVKGLSKLNKTQQNVLKNNQITENLLDTFKKMTKDGVVSFSEADSQRISGIMNQHLNIEKASDDLKSMLESSYKTIKKVFKNDIKAGILISLSGAAIGAATLAIINKVKQNKEEQE